MATPGGARSAMPRPLDAALTLLGTAALILAGVELALLVDEGDPLLWLLVFYPGTGLVYVAAGLLAWWRRPSNRIGTILIGGGVIWLLAALAELAVPALTVLGIVLATVVLGVVVHLLHAFPSGGLRSAASRRTVAAGYAVCLILQVPLYLFDPAASPNGILAAADRPELASAGMWVQRGAGITVMIVTAALLAGRLRNATPTQRRVLGPLYGYGIAAVLLVPAAPNVIQPLTGLSPAVTNAVQIALLAAVPIAFTGGVLLGGFARTSEIQELGAWLGTGAAQRPPLADALAQALGDPSVQLVFWAGDLARYVDADGRSVTLPAPDSRRAMVDVDLADRRIGTIIYDDTLIDDAELVRAAGRVIALAFDRQRLTAELLASQDALRLSRARLVAAGDQERRRIAQQLHDGLQCELVLLALQAQTLAARPGATAEISAAATELRERIDQAAGGLRHLVQQVMPAPLIERGLGAATEDLIDRMPIPTRLHLHLGGRLLPDRVQATAYFVIAEALTNAVKHAQASALTVHLAQADGTLTIEVADDGVGGAEPGPGLGLRGLADRLDVLGGLLRVTSPPGAGTRIRAELPCES